MKSIAYLAALTIAGSIAIAVPVGSQTLPAAVSPTSAAAPAAAPTAATWVVIPFGEPGSNDGHLESATTALTKELQAHGITFALATIQPHASVASSAATLCSTYKGSQIVMGTYHADQTNKINKLAWFMPLVVVASGAMNEAPTHAIVKLDELDCTGAVTKHVQGDGNKTHHGTNADATVVDTIALAMHQATDLITGVTVPDTVSTPAASPAP
ncbi:MAG: hypothetical protein NVSMB31_07130 [Vulcanimicrobiaceae bacterium]